MGTNQSFGLKAFAIVAVISLVASQSWAQKNWQKGPPQVDPSKLKDTEFIGDVAQVTPQGIVAINFSGQPTLIWVHPQQTAVTVTGTAVAEGLKTKMFVRFMGSFDANNKVTEAIKELEIYTPYPTDEKPELTPDTPTQITARVLSFRNGKLTMLASGKRPRKLTADIAEDAKITVNMSNIAGARPGDKIRANGKIHEANIFAQRIEIDLATPLGSKAEPPKKGAPSTPPPAEEPPKAN